MIAIDAGTATLPFMNPIALIEAAVAARRATLGARATDSVIGSRTARSLDAPYRRVERPMTFLFRWRPLCLFPDSRRRNWSAQQTERGGFEPPMDRKTQTGFRDRRIQPLCHLSGGA